MKKCPECGNPSYDGAPVCGNCGFNFPKPKVAASREESIFESAPKEKKESSSNQSTTNILKENKLLIGAIILITLIVICGIYFTGAHKTISNNTPLVSNDLAKFSGGDFSFQYSKDWKEVNESDEEHTDAKFWQNGNNTLIEFYNSTIESSSLKEITQDRISYAQESGSYVELVETISIDGRNTSNIILENSDGNYTRYVSMFSDGMLYVFKISGDSINSVTSEDINSAIKTATIK